MISAFTVVSDVTTFPTTHSDWVPGIQTALEKFAFLLPSGMGSLTVTTDRRRFESTLPGLAYPSSKTALNMLTSQYAKAYPAIRINAVDPGYTATDLNGRRGTQTVEQGAAIIVHMATIAADGPTGGYFDATGTVSW